MRTDTAKAVAAALVVRFADEGIASYLEEFQEDLVLGEQEVGLIRSEVEKILVALRARSGGLDAQHLIISARARGEA